VQLVQSDTYLKVFKISIDFEYAKRYSVFVRR
jgi:hypothetical protein